ncbi:MAG: FAD:protein FMN transferase [Candidatus Nitricoxidivorans perseverans]|uniref:FAD:protein FMN transferase n=1 Tax=Candidatus Nitricoxidivorans perseverans TaxID=2975601 RepID=A0AA49FJK2_9PROT|nr:MAG: FAD:protein FMN transferase [Candidatus Nitricoxidivorans perseverans]
MRAILAVLLALTFAGCARNPLYSQESYVFGTRVEVLVWGEPGDSARGAVAEVLREFDRLHRTYHAWQPSELTALNEAIAAGRPHEVSAELAGLVRDAQRMAAAGDRLFDPGIGRLIALWGFHSDEFKPRLPDPARLSALVNSHPSIADLAVDGAKISSRNTAVALDFGGYLKGVALDNAAAILKARGVRNALINIGGNVMALGSKGGTPWRVGIQHPRSPDPIATLELFDGEAVGTSGDYQRYFELDGRRYSHLLDPRTGRPASASQAVTILVAPRRDDAGAGMWSDAGTKPLFVAGDDWRPLAERMNLPHVLRIDAEGRVEATPAFRKRLKFGTNG